MRSGIGHWEFSTILSRYVCQIRSIHGIEVRGGKAFQLRTAEALDLLRPLSAFEIVRGHLSVIRQGKRSGVRARAKRPTFTVGAPTWTHSALWYAGAIAHDAYHAKLYCDARRAQPATEPRGDAWTGAAAETACLIFQRQVLSALDAAPWILQYVAAHERNPTYQGRSDSWRSWLDYRRRWW